MGERSPYPETIYAWVTPAGQHVWSWKPRRIGPSTKYTLSSVAAERENVIRGAAIGVLTEVEDLKKLLEE